MNELDIHDNWRIQNPMDILQSKLQSIREIKIRCIVTRAKAKWRIEGEKCSRYFCNLEKKT